MGDLSPEPPYESPNRYTELMARPVADLATRFERLVDRSGEHHLWLGSIHTERGTGRIKVNGAVVTAHRAAWELANGPIQPKALVLACPVNPACVRLDHLRLDVAPEIETTRLSRSRKGGGSMRLIRSGTWELRVTAGRWDDGRPRTFNRTVSAKSEAEAAAQLVAFAEETGHAQLPDSRHERDIPMDEAIERFLREYLANEKCRADKTITDYRYLHQKWFSPAIGTRPVKSIESSVMDGLFGQMRREGSC
jgi:hypothetical protein